MGKKVLVEVLVPAAGKAYDVYIPLESRLYEVIDNKINIKENNENNESEEK